MAGDCHTIAAEPRKPSPAHKTIIELFREWEALGVEQEGLVSDDASDELIEAISVQRDGLERRMCAMKPATAGEMAAFLYAYTCAFKVYSDEAKLALDFIAAEESAGVSPKPLAAFSVDFVDLSDELDRIARLSGAMHLACLGDDDPGLIELSMVLQDSIQAFRGRFEAFRKSDAGA